MKAIEIIQEAVDPKQFILSRRFTGPVTPQLVKELLEPKGFKFTDSPRGGDWTKTVYPYRIEVWPYAARPDFYYAQVSVSHWLSGPTRLVPAAKFEVSKMELLADELRRFKFLDRVTEAVDPKQFFLQRRRGGIHSLSRAGPVSMVKLANNLWPTLGWRRYGSAGAQTGYGFGAQTGYGFEIEKAGRLWRVLTGPDGGAVISIWARNNPQGDWAHQEDVRVSDMKYLLSHLKIFGLPIREAIDPKLVMRLMKPPKFPAIGELNLVLAMWGWHWEAIDGGPGGLWYREFAPPNGERKRYELKLTEKHGMMFIKRVLGGHNRWVLAERLYFDDPKKLFSHLRQLRLVIESTRTYRSHGI